jgi:multimeric flavodoxin WrbA
MKIIAFNGSPRKEWNTATLLKKALDGVASQGVETELVHLYDLNFTGCRSCFACKTKDGKSYGRCAVKDDLQPLLKKVEEADALLLGSPMYFGNVSGEMRSLMERLLFPYLTYSKVNPRTLFPKKLHTGFIYTMNAPEQAIKMVKYDELYANNERTFKMIFGGETETLYSSETLQFTDYSKVVGDMFDVEARTKRHEEVFPVDCSKAYEMGVRFAKLVKGEK